MRVTRKGKPGAVWVASRNFANPCKGVENFAWTGGR
jgi:hypothetical protein